MFDFDVLETKEAWAWVDGKVVQRSGEREALGEVTATAREAADEEAERRAAFLRDAVRDRVKNREPPCYLLRKWEECEPAKDLVRHFVLEDAIGVGESIKLREVLKLLDALTWSSAKIAAFFLGDDAVVGETDELAREVLRIFAGIDRESGDSMRFRGLFRLLEILGCSISFFLKQLAEVAYEEPEMPNSLQVGNYRMLRGIGSGFNGLCIYRGEHIVTGRCVAIKWPVGTEELEALKDIGRQNPPWFLGLPELLAHGTYGGKPYVVTELLGSPLTKVLSRLDSKAFEVRWRALRLLGRLVLRRLEALHGCGYVHCDISPENILLGLPRHGRCTKEKAPAPGALTPYLIDFGLAQKHPGGMPLEGDHGSAEWSSVRSASGARRRPEDDLEALGWLMVNGLFGKLPWFDLLDKAYENWDSSRSHRAKAVRKVQELKLQLLNDGWGSLGNEWLKLAAIPPALDTYMQTCRSDRATGMQPDYARFSELLGGREGLSLLEAENEDLKLLQDTLDRLL